MSAFCVPPHSSSLRARRPTLPLSRACRRHTRAAAPCAAATPDVVIVGAGMAGLSTAFELAQRGAAVRVVDAPGRRPAALAAAGMIAPSSERIAPPLLKLAEQSLHMYPAFVNNVQAISGVDVQYVARSDFLVPFFEDTGEDDLIRGDAVRMIEPALSENVVAVQRHPCDASVDNRRLVHALRIACEKLGVTFDDVPVRKIVTTREGVHVAALEKQNGTQIHASHFIVSAGSWTKTLLPMVPIRPVKGQMISLAPPPGSHSVLNHAIYSKVYIVPKNDFTEYYVGATVEERGFDSRNTSAGIKYLIDSAIELIPDMSDYEIREMWAGFRPTTPDEKPIFGHCSFDNLSVITGYYRNGVLLAPIGAKIGAAYAMGQTADLPSELRQVLHEFTLDRFYHRNVHKPAHTSAPHDQPSQVAETHSRSDEAMSKSSTTTDIHVERKIKLWKVTSNGISEPIYPPGWKGPKNVGPIRTFSNESGEHHVPQTFTQEAPTPSPPNEANMSSQSTDPQNPENISAVNDAYDDILHKRGPGMHDKMSQALAENRAYGRKPSSLQTEDGPVLSLSEEEVRSFDAAAEMGYRDMRELEKCFHPDHESVKMTTAETEEADRKQLNSKIIIGGVEFSAPGPGN